VQDGGGSCGVEATHQDGGRKTVKPHEIAITRKFNLGNYQTIDFHIEASLDEGENAVNALRELEKIINDYYEGRMDGLVSMAKTEAEKQ
jgi:uncharacterized protein YggL (DUF469 family)